MNLGLSGKCRTRGLTLPPSKELKANIISTRAACKKLDVDSRKKKRIDKKRLDQLGAQTERVRKALEDMNRELDKAQAELSKTKENPY